MSFSHKSDLISPGCELGNKRLEHMHSTLELFYKRHSFHWMTKEALFAAKSNKVQRFDQTQTDHTEKHFEHLPS